MNPASGLIFIYLFTWTSSPPGNWKDQLVVPNKAESEIRFEAIEGKRVTLAFLAVEAVRVREERGGRLRIFDGHREGWVDKADFVLDRDASAYFQSRIRQKPGDKFAWLSLGILWANQGEYNKAIPCFSMVISLDPRSASAFYGRGNAWLRKQSYDKAISDIDAAIRLDPNNGVLFSIRAGAWAGKDDYDRAIRDYREAIRLDSTNAQFYYGRAVAWMGKKEYGKAITDFDKSIELDPSCGPAFNNRATVHFYLKNYDRAIKDYSATLRLDPNDAEAHFNRGLARTYNQDYDRAIKDFDAAIRLDPGDARAMLSRSQCLFLSRKPAIEGFKQVIELPKAKGPIAVYAGILCHIAARIEKKESEAKAFLEKAKDQCDGWPRPIVSYFQGEFDETMLLKQAAHQNMQTEAHCYIGLDLMLKGEKEAAIAHFRWVEEHGSSHLLEHTIALAELQRLEKK